MDPCAPPIFLPRGGGAPTPSAPCSLPPPPLLNCHLSCQTLPVSPDTGSSDTTGRPLAKKSIMVAKMSGLSRPHSTPSSSTCNMHTYTQTHISTRLVHARMTPQQDDNSQAQDFTSDQLSYKSSAY